MHVYHRSLQIIQSVNLYLPFMVCNIDACDDVSLVVFRDRPLASTPELGIGLGLGLELTIMY